MKKYFILLILNAFVSQLFINAQDTLNSFYYNNLEEMFSKDPNVKRTKLVQKTYSNGNIRSQEFYVKYMNDSSKRFWRIGKAFYYTKNGKLGCTSNVDIHVKTLTDTSFCYEENGKISEMHIYNIHSHNVSVKVIYNLFSLFRKYYENTPGQYIEILFCEGNKISESQYKHFEKKGFVKDGDVIFYKEDGTIEKVMKYKMGEEVK